jgi:type IV secretory pathway VirB2 component (pilin)
MHMPLLAMSSSGFHASLSDPSGQNAMVNAAQWINDALLGSVATTIAIIAVAFIGYMMLSGKVHWRRAVSMIVGCFVLFGARNMIAQFEPRQAIGINTANNSAPADLNNPPESTYDPYAGASLAR